MKKLIIIYIVIFGILIYSCSSIKQKNISTINDDNNVVMFRADSIFQECWKPRDIGENIIGIYSTDTPPLQCILIVAKDSIVYLKRESKRYNLLLLDTFRISIISKQKPNVFKLKDSLNKSNPSIFDTCYSSNVFFLFQNDTNYLLFYKTIDENGNTIKFPESDYFGFYFTSLFSTGIEKRIIEYYFDPQIAKLPKLKYEIPDSIYKKLSTHRKR